MVSQIPMPVKLYSPGACPEQPAASKKIHGDAAIGGFEVPKIQNQH
jgi:hypothetical protein